MSLIIRTTGVEDFLDGGTAHIKMLVMGAPSAGKTRSASFWPRPIYADCEKGRMSIADRKVPYAEILSTSDMDELLARLKSECRKPPAERAYQTLVIDTLDAYQRIVIQERLDAERKESLSGWADWGYLDGKLTTFVAKLHSLPMNIVVNVHTKDVTVGDDDEKISTVGVKLKGDIKDQIAAEFDLVGHMGTYWEAEGGERVLKRGIQWHSEPTKPILKDRSGRLPKWTPISFSPDDYANIFEHVTGGLDELAESQVVETIQVEGAAEPVAPGQGGPVEGAALVPPTTKAKKAEPKPPKGDAKAEAEKATAALRGDEPESSTRAAVLEGTPETPPTPVGSAAGARTSVPPAPRPQVAGASSAPSPEPPVVLAEAAQEPAAAPDVEVAAVQAAVEGLGAEVISQPEATEPSSTTEAPATVAEVESVDEATPDEAQAPAVPLCGTSSNEGEEGQPGKQEGCGQPVDPDDDITQIGVFKTRTYLCPACYAAYKTAKQSIPANA